VTYDTPVRFSKRATASTEPLHVTNERLTAHEGGSAVMVMTLLQDRVPLSLLYDLWNPDGPESWEILAVERGWLDPRSLDRQTLAGV
jgi:hypothetical protein